MHYNYLDLVPKLSPQRDNKSEYLASQVYYFQINLNKTLVYKDLRSKKGEI